MNIREFSVLIPVQDRFFLKNAQSKEITCLFNKEDLIRYTKRENITHILSGLSDKAKIHKIDSLSFLKKNAIECNFEYKKYFEEVRAEVENLRNPSIKEKAQEETPKQDDVLLKELGNKNSPSPLVMPAKKSATLVDSTKELNKNNVYYFALFSYAPTGFDEIAGVPFYKKGITYSYVNDGSAMFLKDYASFLASLNEVPEDKTVVLTDNTSILGDVFNSLQCNVVHIEQDKIETVKFYENNPNVRYRFAEKELMLTTRDREISLVRDLFKKKHDDKSVFVGNPKARLTVGASSFFDLKNRVFSDASFVNKESKSGYGIVIVSPDLSLRKIKGSFKEGFCSSSNEAETIALYKAISLAENGTIVYSDSINAIENIHKLTLTGSKKDDTIDKVIDGKVLIRWIKGHDEHKYNEMADELSKAGRLDV